MKLFFSLAAFAALTGAAFWAMFASEPPLPLRIMIVFGSFAVFAVVVVLVGNFLHRRRLERNQSHYLARGFEFHAAAALDEVSLEANLFEHHNVRIEQLARGKSLGTAVEIYDLAYETFSADTEGHSSSYFVSQTVVALPVAKPEVGRLLIVPLRGIGGGLIRLLGLTSRIERASVVSAGDSDLIAWFNRHYMFTHKIETSKGGIEQLLNTSLLEWLQRHQHLAFEVSQGKLLVWVPGRVVDSTARDELVNEALELRAKLETRSTTSNSGVVVLPPAASLERGLMRNLALAGCGSWAIAVVFGILGFWLVISAGWIDRAPLATMICLMTATLLVWIGTGVLILRRLTNR